MKPAIVSLFDYTGEAVRPWAEAGHPCYIFDIQHRHGYHRHEGIPNTVCIKADLTDDSEVFQYLHGMDIGFLMGFPPCNHLAVSGAAHFKGKGLRVLSEAIGLFATATEIANWLKVPYYLENPVSTIASYWRKPDYSFHLYEYGGYLPPDSPHPRWAKYIANQDRYPKKTCLWTGYGFVMPEKIPVDCPEGYSTQYKKLGGKSLKTKNIRSATPRGFARAVYEANKEIALCPNTNK